MKPLDRILAAVRARPRHIILPEGGDPRVQAGPDEDRVGLALIEDPLCLRGIRDLPDGTAVTYDLETGRDGRESATNLSLA